MANSRQQIKRAKTDKKRSAQNTIFKSGMRRAIKAVELHIANNEKDKAQEALTLANKKLDKAQVRGIVHKNFVARHKSRLAQKVNAL